MPVKVGELAQPELPLASAATVVRRIFMLLLLGVYGLATFAPGLGIATRDISVSPVYFGVPIPLAAALLAVLLFSAGLGVNVTELSRMRRYSTALIVGLAASWLLGPAAAALLSVVMKSADGAVAACLGGLALVAMMPPANSSAAWTQNTGGDLRLNLGLIVAATLLCPLAAPAAATVLSAVPGVDSTRWMQGAWGMMLLMVWIAVPIGLGIATRMWLRPGTIERYVHMLSLSNSLILLLLNYCQASLALPRLLGGGAGLLAPAVFSAVTFTIMLFAGAWLVARASGADRQQRLSLLFGLGMKNTGAALALAGPMLAAHPAALLTIILCTLSQHLLAGFCDLLLGRNLNRIGAPRALKPDA